MVHSDREGEEPLSGQIEELIDSSIQLQGFPQPISLSTQVLPPVRLLPFVLDCVLELSCEGCWPLLLGSGGVPFALARSSFP